MKFLSLIASGPLALLAIAAAPLLATPATQAAPGGDKAKNLVLVTFGEGFFFPKGINTLYATIAVQLGDYPGNPALAVVTVITDIETYTLEWDPVEQWHEVEGPLNSLDELRKVLNGSYTVDIQGVSPSRSTFSFNAAALTDDQVYSQPTILSPTDGSTIPGSASMSWTAPVRGPSSPLFIEPFLFVLNQPEGESGGLLPAGTTSWDPGFCIFSGAVREFQVEYVSATPPSLYTPLTVVSGSIEWSNFSFMPEGSPATGPVIGTVGSARSVFVTSPCIVGDLNGDSIVGAADIALLLGAWGATGGEADINGDGTVGAADLALLLGNWTS